MLLENQVCSLELSNRLKDIGVNQESLFYWHWYKKNRDYEDIDILLQQKKMEDFDDGKWKGKCYSAFTVAELGEMLPKKISNPKDSWSKLYLKFEPASKPENWLISYGNDIRLEESTEANSRAKMIIHLLENNLMELPK